MALVQFTYNAEESEHKKMVDRRKRGKKMIELTKEARAARAKYMREWRKKNPEKEREYTARKWEKKGQQIREERAAAIDRQ